MLPKQQMMVQTEDIDAGDIDQSDPFEIPFPLPEHNDPSMCRDEFLRSIVEEHELRVSSLKTEYGYASRAQSVFGDELRLQSFQPVFDVNVMAVMQLARQRQKSPKTTAYHIPSFRKRTTLLMDLNRQCQKAAIEFLSVRLLKQLRLFSRPWPGRLDEIPHNLFSWSLDHFMARLSVKQVYLDVIHRERTSEDLDCLKFRTDLHEIGYLIHKIRKDFRDDQDIRKGSYELIRKAQYVTKAPWVKSLENHEKEAHSLTHINLLGSKTSFGQMTHRTADLMDLYDNVAAQDPIEVRYQVNWVNSCADQYQLKLAGREHKVWRELKDLRDKAEQDHFVQHQSEAVYCKIVESLKEKINEWQERYDRDLEQAELKNALARSALAKARDDLKFFKAQEKMYLRRIAEEQELMAKEQRIRDERERALQARRSSRMSARMSAMSQKRLTMESQRGKRLTMEVQKRLTMEAQKEKRLTMEAQKRLTMEAQKEKRLTTEAQKGKRQSAESQMQKRDTLRKSVRKSRNSKAL